MSGPTFKSIGVVANLDKEGVPPLLASLIPELQKAGFDVAIDPALRAVVDTDAADGIADDVDLVIALGGDGTILKFARQYAATATPILGIKAGRLGFLTEPYGEQTVEQLKSGHFVVQKRMRVVGAILEGDKVVEEVLGAQRHRRACGVVIRAWCD